MLTIVRLVERLAVTARAAVVHVEHGITVVHQILHARDVRHPRLASRAAMHTHDGRHFVLRAGAVGLIANGGNFRSVERLVAHHPRVDEIGRVDLRAQAFRELERFLLREIVNIQIARRARAVVIKNHLRFALRDIDSEDIAFGERRQWNKLPGGFFGNLDLRPRVFIRGDDAILPVVRERHVGNIPRRFLGHVALSRSEVITRDVFELTAFVRKEVEILRIHIKGRGAVVHIAGVRRDVLHLFRSGVVEINVRVGRRTSGLAEGEELLVVRDVAELVAGLVLVEQHRF